MDPADTRATLNELFRPQVDQLSALPRPRPAVARRDRNCSVRHLLENGSSMAVLVTGGAGYIGSQTVRHLQAAGRDVVVLDSMEFGHRDAVPGVPIVEADIADTDAVDATVKEHERRRRRSTSPRTRPRASRWSCPAATSTTTS